jgi:hypothetical protein
MRPGKSPVLPVGAGEHVVRDGGSVERLSVLQDGGVVAREALLAEGHPNVSLFLGHVLLTDAGERDLESTDSLRNDAEEAVDERCHALPPL